MADRIREHRYQGAAPPWAQALVPQSEPTARLIVDETRAGDRHLRLTTWDADNTGGVAIYLDAEQAERLGIDLQIRASYMRGVRPPTGPEPDPVDPGPCDVPLLEGDADAP